MNSTYKLKVGTVYSSRIEGVIDTYGFIFRTHGGYRVTFWLDYAELPSYVTTNAVFTLERARKFLYRILTVKGGVIDVCEN